MTLVCAAKGYPTPSYSWFIQGDDEDVAIRGSDSLLLEVCRITSPSLSVQSENPSLLLSFEDEKYKFLNLCLLCFLSLVFLFNPHPVLQFRFIRSHNRLER